MAKSFFSGIVLLFSTIIVETAILSNIDVLPVVPDLLLIALLYVALKNGRLHGEILGFFSGLFLDLMAGVPLGFNCLVRTALGYVAGSFGSYINTDGLVIPAVAGAAATFAKMFLTSLVGLLFPSMVSTPTIFSKYFLFEFVLNVILTSLFFKFLSIFKSFLVIDEGEPAL